MAPDTAPTGDQDRITDSAATRTTDWAIEVVARMAMYAALDKIEWEDYPEIGEHDWRPQDAAR